MRKEAAYDERSDCRSTVASSARYIFGASQIECDMDKLRATLEPGEWTSRTKIMEHTQRNIPAPRLDAALGELLRIGEAETRPPTDARRKNEWRLLGAK